MKSAHKIRICMLATLIAVLPTFAQIRTGVAVIREKDKAFFVTDEARRIGDQILLYQRASGGWPKNIDMAKPLSDDERKAVEKDKARPRGAMPRT